MWNEPYLETCCRSALHRVMLSGAAGRPLGLPLGGHPLGLKDGPCLARLGGMGLVRTRADGRVEITPEGAARHASEVARRGGTPVSPVAR